MGDAGEMASVRAHSDGGIANPMFHDRTMPAPLAEAGMSQEAWLALLDAGDKAVVFQWGCTTICCFMCFAHHKDIKPRAMRFVEALNQRAIPGASLPTGIVARYQMQTEQHSVAASGGAGSGASTETYHKILFFRESAAPPSVQMMDRQLPKVR
mmetsp:Transcript_27513/g.70066  ORF Transcript_27513/g.70066 Transcript_27513/m.70066 type:complete len:154 (-) Transcript_27513:365-826(-)|eukprot:CAMPEP_0115832072 /NCGR_PEP_ID=MMETSP0287-20121206/2467_1 /TAXON_ID=412157 /ORGANISM="Chrysochromulina rotalis, Strain UIO044" /LENGTH=153 /DNA_ID=CAMNT_0003285441 /DNA_START=19 /DNA_END=480 /DNA_ORIENTATION=+